jgi:hypothetical protein
MILTLQRNIENADHSMLVMTGHYGTEWNKSEDLQVEGLRQFSGCHEWATGLFGPSNSQSGSRASGTS